MKEESVLLLHPSIQLPSQQISQISFLLCSLNEDLNILIFQKQSRNLNSHSRNPPSHFVKWLAGDLPDFLYFLYFIFFLNTYVPVRSKRPSWIIYHTYVLYDMAGTPIFFSFFSHSRNLQTGNSYSPRAQYFLLTPCHSFSSSPSFI